MRKKYLNILFTVLAGLFLLACDGNEASSSVDPDADIDETLFTISMLTLDVNSSTIKIPIEIFGTTDSANLEGAAVDLYINDVIRVTDLPVTNLFHSESNEVIFILSPLEDGDLVGMTITNAEGGELYYEGTVSASADTEASISVLTEPTDEEDGAVEAFFEEMQSLQGDALGSSRSGRFEITFNGFNYSSNCDAEFIQILGFYMSSSISVEEAQAIIDAGADASATAVDITNADGVMTWDDQDSTATDFVGANNADGSFSLFDGDFVDEGNYTYTLYQGEFSDDEHFSGTLLATIVMDGERLQSTLVGACTVSSTFSGEFLSE